MLVGGVIGIPVGVAANALTSLLGRNREKARIRRQFSQLATRYRNYRVVGGVEKETGGTVEISHHRDGSFGVIARHATGDTEWEGRFSMDEHGTGTGSYKYPFKPHYGRQLLTYLPESRSLHVLGTNLSHPEQPTYIHHWRPLETLNTPLQSNEGP